MKRLALFLFLLGTPLLAQAQTPASSAPNPLQSLSFLEGTWEAKIQGGSSGGQRSGSYTFQRELKNHILARHTKNAGECKGPEAFDCDHGDLLYVFPASDGHSLKAIYFDNEGHVISYNLSTPTATSAEFLSEAQQGAPQFRLSYELRKTVMFGKFEIRMPGQAEWKSYLEWSGSKQP